MLSTPPNSSQEIPTMLHLILKAYKTSIVIQLSKHQQSAESLVPWGRLLFQVVNLQIPNEAVPENEEERERSEWWKAKKWAYNTLGRLFHRFVAVCSFFVVSRLMVSCPLATATRRSFHLYSKRNIKDLLSILSLALLRKSSRLTFNRWSFSCRVKRGYLANANIISSSFSRNGLFLFHLSDSPCTDRWVSIKPGSTWTLLKPHFESLVSSMVFPQLSFTPARKELWERDPVDFVRLFVGTI